MHIFTLIHHLLENDFASYDYDQSFGGETAPI